MACPICGKFFCKCRKKLGPFFPTENPPDPPPYVVPDDPEAPPPKKKPWWKK